MKIRDCMKHRVISIRNDATIGSAATLFREHHIGTLPVVDSSRHLIGVIRLHSLLALVMPDFVKLVNHFDYVHDFGALESRQPDATQLKNSVLEIIDEPTSVQADDGLIMAAACIQEHHLMDLPVVDQNNILVGLSSHVDIGVALMSNWHLPNPPLLELT